MSIMTEILLMCDGGKAGLSCPEDSPFNIDGAKDAKVVSPAILRQSAAGDGWVKVGQKDYCAACAAQLKPK